MTVSDQMPTRFRNFSDHTSESSSFQLRGNDGHGVGPYLGSYEIGSSSSIIIFIIISYLFNHIF